MTAAQPIATPVSTRHFTADHRHISSPSEHSPDTACTAMRQKRANGATTASKRPRRAQPINNQVADENIDPSLVSIPSVGPSSTSIQLPAARPHPIADYSPISKANKKPESKSSATDVWYFVQPLEQREPPSDKENLPDIEPSCYKPKTPFVGCRLCEL
jgi:hypothetical protein